MEGSENTSNTQVEIENKAQIGGSGEIADEEKRKLADEFNLQRARMRDLYLQKEDELRHMCSEKVQLENEVAGLREQLEQVHTLTQNQQSEIQSLQMLIHETVEASSSGNETARILQLRNLELEQQLNLLAKQQQQQDAALAPAAIVRSLARKLGADTDHEDTKKNPDELERSCEVERLEQEIKALKDKLRNTDNQLQAVLSNKNNSKIEVGTGADGRSKCDMCINYEQQLVREQKCSEEARVKAVNAERALKLATQELENTRRTQDETAHLWRTSRSTTAAQLTELTTAVEELRRQLAQRALEVTEHEQRALKLVTSLTVQRETLQEHLDNLQRDNDMLMGKYTKKAQELQNEDINLPDTVEELQEQCLLYHERLIVAEIGREEALTANEELRLQLQHQGGLFHDQTKRYSTLAGEYHQLRQTLDRLETEREQMTELADKLRHSNDTIEKLLDDKKRLQNEVMELRSRVSSLQQDLDNSEKVQQDFVRLSQSLQVQLERIRESETEVRWQHEEDVNECPQCHTSLTNNKRKVHCRHCGRIFCGTCVSHVVCSGPRGAESRVCAVCRTLLQPHTAPYFSTAPPHTPD